MPQYKEFTQARLHECTTKRQEVIAFNAKGTAQTQYNTQNQFKAQPSFQSSQKTRPQRPLRRTQTTDNILRMHTESIIAENRRKREEQELEEQKRAKEELEKKMEKQSHKEKKENGKKENEFQEHEKEKKKSENNDNSTKLKTQENEKLEDNQETHKNDESKQTKQQHHETKLQEASQSEVQVQPDITTKAPIDIETIRKELLRQKHQRAELEERKKEYQQTGKWLSVEERIRRDMNEAKEIIKKVCHSKEYVDKSSIRNKCSLK